MGHILAGGLLAWLYHHQLLRKAEKPFSLSACIVSGILSAFLILGISFSTFGNFDFITHRKVQSLIAAITFVGFWGILYTLIKMLYAGLDTLKVRERVYVGALKKLDEHFLIICICVLLACWMIQALPFFPGSVPHDGRNQFNQYFGLSTLTSHHPVAATWLMGLIYSIGKSLFGTTGGCVFYVGFQMLYASQIFGRISDYIRQKTGLLGAGIAAALFFALAPMFWTYLQTLDKDALYMISFAWFGLEYIKTLWHDGGKYGIVRLILSACIICVVRNEGCYIVVPALIVLIIICVDKRRLAALALAVVLVCNYGWNTALMDYLEIEPTNQVEGVSLFLQMIARYSLYYGDELTQEEQDIITTVVAYDGMADRYNPVNADPVKNYGYRNTSEEEWDAFWDLWWELFTRHPLVYIEAVMNEVYGYIDPFYYYTGLTTYQLYNKESFGDYDSEAVYSEYVMSSSIRTGAGDAVYIWSEIPVLSLIVCPGFYSWLGIILIGALLRKRDYRNTLTFITPFMVLLVCFASPVNGYLRYTLPIMAGMPMYFLVGLKPYWNRKDLENLIDEK